MGRKSPTIRALSIGLTREERAVLDEIAEREDVSLSSVVRDLIAEKYPDTFGKVSRHRSGYGGRERASST